MRARSPRRPPKLQQGSLFFPHTQAMILGVSASAPRSKREKQTSMRARARQSSDSLRAKTAIRLEIVTKSLRSIFTKEDSFLFTPCCLLG